MQHERHDEILDRLGSHERSIQRAACDEARSRLGQDPELRDLLLEQLNEGTPHARFAAAFVFFQDRPTLRLLPALLASLELADGDLRWSATHMLATLGRLHGEVFPVLLNETQPPAAPVRRRMAIYALRELAPERVETQRALLAALADPHPDVGLAALSSLAKLHEPGSACLDHVLSIAQAHDDPRMQRIATVILPDLAIHHPQRRHEVRECLDSNRASSDAGLDRATRSALRRLDTPPD